MRHRQPQRQYPRMARVNELLREILADTLERIDDDRLQFVTVTGVECEADLRRARVYYDSLAGPEGDEIVLAGLAELRPRLQATVNRETRMKRTPELRFEPDPAVRTAQRLEAVLREIEPPVDQPADRLDDQLSDQPGGGDDRSPQPLLGDPVARPTEED